MTEIDQVKIFPRDENPIERLARQLSFRTSNHQMVDLLNKFYPVERDLEHYTTLTQVKQDPPLTDEQLTEYKERKQEEEKKYKEIIYKLAKVVEKAIQTGGRKRAEEIGIELNENLEKIDEVLKSQRELNSKNGNK